MRLAKRGWAGSLILGAAVAGCSPSSGASTSNDSGPEGDSGGSSGPSGLVAFYQGGGADSDAFTLVAAFDEGSGMLGGTSACSATVDGCTYCSSAADAGTKPGDLKIKLLGAGTLTFKADAKTLATLKYSSKAGDYETSSVTDSGLTWAAGDTLSVTATGGAIPAFSASIPSPHAITGVKPAFSLSKAVNTSDDDAFVVSWTPSSDDGTMSLVLGYDMESHPGTVGCTAAESTGKITVPASVVKQLTGGAAGSGTVGLTKMVTKPVSVTGASVKIQASPPGVSGSLMFN
jgi:hypothetical protein